MTNNQKLLFSAPMQPFMRPSHVKTLHWHLRKETKQSFIELIKNVEQALATSFNLLVQKLERLDTSSHFSPLFYFYYFSLLEAMCNQDRQEVRKLCRFLTTVNVNRFYSYQLLIDNQQKSPIINFHRHYIYQTSHRIETFRKLSPADYEKAQENISRVFNVIKQANESFYSEIQEIVSVLHLSKGIFLTIAATSLKYFGMLILRYKSFTSPEEQFLYFFDSIVHESSHIFLNLLMAFDPIVLNSTEQHYSPARNSSRSLKGIFHAHFVFFRLIIMYKLAAKFLIHIDDGKKMDCANLPIRDLPYAYEKRLQAYEVKFKQGEEILLNHAKLTEFGTALLQSLNLESNHALPNSISP